MACAPFEFLRIIKESAYGTQKGSLSAGDSAYVRLTENNAFAMRPVPTMRKVAMGNGFATQAYTVADQYVCEGALQLILCGSQAELLLNWGLSRINSLQTTPWTTSEQACDLASCAVYHGILRDDGTIKRTRYKGVKVHSVRIASAASNGLVMLTLGLRAQKFDGNAIDSTSDPDATAFPAPADTDFPTDPFLHRHLTMTVASSAVTYCNSIELNVTNTMSINYANSAFLKFDRLRGRQSTANGNFIYTASPNWRSDFTAITARAASFAWANGTNTVTIDYNANNIVGALTDNLVAGQVYEQNVTWENQWDTSASEDISFTFA